MSYNMVLLDTENYMNKILKELQTEYNLMPESHLKFVAIKSYGLKAKDIKDLNKKQLIDDMLAIEFKNCYQ